MIYLKAKLVVLGAGGLGREVAWQISQIRNVIEQYHVIGFVDDNPELQGKVINGLPNLGGIDFLINYTEEIAVVICLANPKIRREIYEKLSINPKISFPTIIANDVQHSDTVKFGKGCIICLSNIYTVNIEVGDFVISNSDCIVGHDVVLGDFVTIYPSVSVSGNVYIGDGTEIGTGTNIIQGKRIGEQSIIGAGSVVVGDIPKKCTAVGIPAKPIKFHK